MMKTFEKTTMIRCSVEELFDFHLDIENLKKITPSNIKVEILNEKFEAKEGEILKIRSSKFFVSTNWEVEIKKIQKPNILIDKALKSPFKFWEHTHTFAKKGNQCELKDIIKYELPFGFLNPILEFFFEKELLSIFSYRHKKTKELITNSLKIVTFEE
ncbi:SRPBCC family protein [Halarcobacter ebronensis]|nr:SRPBCC family protein [Halarcobacter ebronensis]QKF82692.1 hypothetical protein AEBR_2224 [Halarcobacter ebronensis]